MGAGTEPPVRRVGGGWRAVSAPGVVELYLPPPETSFGTPVSPWTHAWLPPPEADEDGRPVPPPSGPSISIEERPRFTGCLAYLGKQQS